MAIFLWKANKLLLAIINEQSLGGSFVIQSAEDAFAELVTGLDDEIAQQLSPWMSTNSIFDILGISGAEIRHSNFLAWLFRPSSIVTLQDDFLKQVLLQLIRNGNDLPISALDILMANYTDLTVDRERDYMDIFMQSATQRLTVVIENKVFTGQHDNQLHRYQEIAAKAAIDPKRVVRIYLTPDGHDPQDENWLPLSYQDIYTILRSLLPKVPAGRERYFIEDYLENLRTNVMNDEQLQSTVAAIYNKYKPALDLIINNLPDETSAVREDFSWALHQLEKEGLVSLVTNDGGRTLIRFRTPNMDQAFSGAMTITAAQNSWSNGSPYFFEIHFVPTGDITIKIAFHTTNQSDEVMQRINEVLTHGETALPSASAQWKTYKKSWQVNIIGNTATENLRANDHYSQERVLDKLRTILTTINKINFI